ncbi:MAG: PBSX family phage terminase large subunit [Cetobacterium sp.]|uniref:PBSX family phage terminase large subunit n=1 Tax=Cetobacterium sp. TaxID=2071632 RepID=UPI003EE78F3A
MARVEINKHFWDYINNWEKRFYFIVGGYGSSKSYNTAVKLVMKAVNEPDRKILVVRNVFATIKESCYDILKEVVETMGLEKKFRFKTSPLSIECVNGTRFIFKGLDKTEKLKSLHGVSIIWIEEAPEIPYKAFKELNGRLRTMTQSMHIIMSQNPVSKNSWCYARFFTDKGLDERELYEKRIILTSDTYYHHSVVDDNKFVPVEYIGQLEELKLYDPYLYDVARKGRFGVLGIRVLPQVEYMEHGKMLETLQNTSHRMKRHGMDFGFETSFNAIIKLFVDEKEKYLYIFWEYYKNKMTDDEVIEEPELQFLRENEDRIIADSAEPKTIKFYRKSGFNMTPCTKFQGSRLANTKKIKRFKKIFISSQCPKCYSELKELTYKEDKNGNIIPDQFNIDPHTFSAIWYALDGYEVADLKEISYF